jgi:hypothetical protein
MSTHSYAPVGLHWGLFSGFISGAMAAILSVDKYTFIRYIFNDPVILFMPYKDLAQIY